MRKQNDFILILSSLHPKCLPLTDFTCSLFTDCSLFWSRVVSRFISSVLLPLSYAWGTVVVSSVDYAFNVITVNLLIVLCQLAGVRPSLFLYRSRFLGSSLDFYSISTSDNIIHCGVCLVWMLANCDFIFIPWKYRVFNSFRCFYPTKQLVLTIKWHKFIPKSTLNTLNI